MEKSRAAKYEYAGAAGRLPRDFSRLSSVQALPSGLLEGESDRPGTYRAAGPDTVSLLQKDKEEERSPGQDAAELLGALCEDKGMKTWLQFPLTRRWVPLPPNVTICGVDKDGNDQTNEISWLILETMAQTKLSEPAVYIRYSPDMDPELFCTRCAMWFGGGIRHF